MYMISINKIFMNFIKFIMIIVIIKIFTKTFELIRMFSQEIFVCVIALDIDFPICKACRKSCVLSFLTDCK